jgi:hypothetical protein
MAFNQVLLKRGESAMANATKEVRKSEDKVIRHAKKEIDLEKLRAKNQEEGLDTEAKMEQQRGRNSPMFLQFFYLFSKKILNCF